MNNIDFSKLDTIIEEWLNNPDSIESEYDGCDVYIDIKEVVAPQNSNWKSMHFNNNNKDKSNVKPRQ